MAQDWNPNEPTLVGCEWLPTVEGVEESVNGGANAPMLVLPSTAAQTIDRANFYVGSFTDPNYASGLIEVCVAGQEIPGATTTDTFRPNEDTAAVNMQNQAGAGVNLFQSIDEAVLDYTDYITGSTAAPAAANYTCKLATAAWPATGRRVTDVRIVLVGEQITGVATWSIELRKQSAGFLTGWRSTKSSSDGVFTESVSFGDINPFTGLPWTATEIQSLDDIAAADRLSLVWRLTGMNTAFDIARLYQMYLEVDYVTENRVAVARGTINSSGWFSFAVQVPDTGADNWAKLAATTYSYMIRRIQPPTTPGASTGVIIRAAQGAFGWRYGQASGEEPFGAMPLAGCISYRAAVAADGTVSALNNLGTRGYGLILRTTGPVTSVDGIPYESENRSAEVETGVTIRQRVTPAGNGTVERVRFMVGTLFAALPDADLTIRVRNDGSGVQVGGNGTLTLAEIDSSQDASRRQIVTVTLAASGALVAATQYRVELTSASTAGNPWLIGYGRAIIASYGIPSYGGQTDDGDWAGTGYDDEADLFLQLVDPGDAPSAVTAVVETIPNPAALDGCTIESVDTVIVGWTWPTVGADAYVEIERYDAPSATWELVATIEDQAVDEWTDYEVRPSTATYPTTGYRLRVVDVVESNWTATVTCSPESYGCGLIFASNETATIYAWPDVFEGQFADRAWEQPDAETIQTVPIYGRDYQIAMSPTERLGDTFSRTLAITSEVQPVLYGRWPFDDLIDFTRNPDAPYIAVFDETGRRWLSSVVCASVSDREPLAIHNAAVAVTQILGTPIAVTV